jgi:hypothetical protein
MNAAVLGGLVRHILTVAGGYLVATGGIDEPTMIGAVGAIMTLLGVAWSFYQKKAA